MNDWIKWDGGPCPVPTGTIVDVKYRDGGILRAIPASVDIDSFPRDASVAFWSNDGQTNDIVAYRLVSAGPANDRHDALVRVIIQATLTPGVTLTEQDQQQLALYAHRFARVIAEGEKHA